jgi:predicted DCC family thiol-disulfide oxidoreductase YuxK
MGAVVLFDGVCNFCDRSVNFIIDHDKRGYFKFAPLQSEEGGRLAAEYGFEPAVGGKLGEDGLVQIDSVILVEGGQAYTHSTAALRIVRGLSPPWPMLYALVVVPRFIRDYFYKLFARYRYRFFGKKDQCMIPTPEIRARFLT